MCECYKIGGPFIAEDPECPVHGTEASSHAASSGCGSGAFSGHCVWPDGNVTIWDGDAIVLMAHLSGGDDEDGNELALPSEVLARLAKITPKD